MGHRSLGKRGVHVDGHDPVDALEGVGLNMPPGGRGRVRRRSACMRRSRGAVFDAGDRCTAGDTPGMGLG